jgi:hypothetical protein
MAKTAPEPVDTVEPPAPQDTVEPPATAADPDDLRGGIVRFGGTIAKYNAAGDYTLSDHLAPGETRVPGA